MNEKKTKNGMNEIAQYLEELKFKPAIVGGVDKEDALLAIKKVYGMFNDIHEEEIKKIQSTSNEKLEQSNKLIAKLQEKQASLEKELQLRSTGAADEIREKEWEERLEKLKKRHEVDLTKEEDLVAALKEEISQEKQKAHERENELQKEIAQLEEKILVIQKDAELLQKNYQKDIALARAGAEERSETLEEIYLEAREMRNRVQETAKAEAEEILAEAREEAEKAHVESEEALQVARAEAERIIEESKDEAKAVHSQILKESEEKYHLIQQDIAKAEQDVVEAQKKVEESVMEAESLTADVHRAAQEKLDAAEAALEEAKTEAKCIVDSAKIPYMQECEKYNALLMQLGDLRASTVRNIQDSVTKLSNLMFDMTSEGIKLDTENSISMAEMEENFGHDDN